MFKETAPLPSFRITVASDRPEKRIAFTVIAPDVATASNRARSMFTAETGIAGHVVATAKVMAS